MPVPVLHVCDRLGVRGSSMHGLSRPFARWCHAAAAASRCGAVPQAALPASRRYDIRAGVSNMEALHDEVLAELGER